MTSNNTILDEGWQNTDRTAHYIKAGEEKTMCKREKRYTVMPIELVARMPICKFCLRNIQKELASIENFKYPIQGGEIRESRKNNIHPWR